MSRSSFIRYAAGIFGFAAAACVAHAQSDVWAGGFPNDYVNTASNWYGGILPSGYMSGTDTLFFTDVSSPNMNLNTPGLNFEGIIFRVDYNGVDHVNLYGSNAFPIASNGTNVETECCGS
jgi:hypothetical protein